MSFPLTRLALAALDAHATYVDAPDEPTFDAKQADLTVAVGAAFAEDTSGLNRADMCAELAASGPGLVWIRSLVDNY